MSQIKIIIEKELEDFWASEEVFKELSDEDIINLIHEDLYALLENATFKVVRQ